MRTRAIILIVLVVVGGAVWMLLHRPSSSDKFDRKQNVLSAEARRVLDGSERFVLLSLTTMATIRGRESDPPQKETFHDYAVLGKIEIRDQKERAELLNALYKGMADSDGTVAGCFNPRHGISATLAGETVDLVICFECLSIVAYAKDVEGVLTTAFPQPTFNRALERAGLTIDEDK